MATRTGGVLMPRNKRTSKRTGVVSDSNSFSSTSDTIKPFKNKSEKVAMSRAVRRLSCSNDTTISNDFDYNTTTREMMMARTTALNNTTAKAMTEKLKRHGGSVSKNSNKERGASAVATSKEEILQLLAEDLMMGSYVENSYLSDHHHHQSDDNNYTSKYKQNKFHHEKAAAAAAALTEKKVSEFCRKERKLIASRNKDDKEIYQLLTEDLFSSDPDTLARALDKLSDFCNSTVVKSEIRASKNGKYIVDHDGVGVMIQVMKANIADLTILAVGARALANLMYSYDGAREKVHRLGGSQTILKGMKTHPDDALVQRNGVGFFQNVIADDDECKRFFALELEGIQAIVTAMMNHPKNSDLQRYGVRALCFLSEENEFVDLVEKKGGLVAVSTCLRLHREDPSIVKPAKKLIKALSDHLQLSNN